MRPKPLRSRDDLLALVTPHAPSAACKRAILEDRILVLGSFIAPGGFPQLVVSVTSYHGRTWFIGLEIDEEEYEFRILYPKSITWSQWTGGRYRKNEAYDGDYPNTFAKWRDDGVTHTTETPPCPGSGKANPNGRSH